MKITKRQLRRIIREAVDSHTVDELEALELIEEMGYNYTLPFTHMENQTAINDALEGYPGVVMDWGAEPLDVIESAVKKEEAHAASRPTTDPVMLNVLYELTPADEMEGWDDDPGLWSAVEVDVWPSDEVALLWAGSPAGWVEFGIHDEDIEDVGSSSPAFYKWMESQGALVRRKNGPAPKKLLHMLGVG